MGGPSPQWLVFIIDIVFVILASVLTLHFNANTTDGRSGWIFTMDAKILTVAVIYALSMFTVKSYRSIVRLSTFHDTYRIALAITTASLILIAIDLVFGMSGYGRYIGIWSIFVLAVISFALLISLRLCIKYIYNTFKGVKTRTRVAVLGSSINTLAVTSALLSEIDGSFEPVLMLSTVSNSSGGTVNGIPTRNYDPEKIGELFREFNCDTLLFMSSQIDFIREKADALLSNHIRLLKLNNIQEFDMNEEERPQLSSRVQNINIEDLLGRDPIITKNPMLDGSLRDKTILITGAAGSIGSEIVRQVAGHAPGRIVLVDQAETPMHELQLEMEQFYPNVQIILCIADVVNRPRMKYIFDRWRPQIVYHAAAYKHVPMMERNPVEAIQTNILGTKTVADLAMSNNTERFVMISTDKAVNPTNIMGASKRIAEIYVQSLALSMKNSSRNSTRFITTRFGNVLGSNGSVIPLFRKQIARGGPVTVTHQDIIRYFMTIPEACSLVLEAGCLGKGGEIFIFDMGKPVRIYDLAKRMISLAGLRPNEDIKIVETGLRPGEKLFEELLNDHEHTIPTDHKKIMVAKVRTYNYSEVCQRLNHLFELIASNNEHDLVAAMKCLVPEFKSQNSTFVTIDSEIKEKDVIHELDQESD